MEREVAHGFRLGGLLALADRSYAMLSLLGCVSFDARLPALS